MSSAGEAITTTLWQIVVRSLANSCGTDLWQYCRVLAFLLVYVNVAFTLCGGYLDKNIKEEEMHQSLCSNWAKVQDEVLTLRR